MMFEDSLDESSFSAKKLRRHYLNVPLLRSIAHPASSPSPDLTSSMAAMDLSNQLLIDGDHIMGYTRTPALKRCPIEPVKALDGIHTPLVEVDDNFIESMLLGLKENKKILIPTFHVEPVESVSASSSPRGLPMSRRESFSFPVDFSGAGPHRRICLPDVAH
eukprot:TRINITY_DN626_c0_g1_i1.p1 TRINITY_DN626_c0_g1~~TRINITY_DN626_c0_g1_i1.p1  ORF type:complete len:162 (-),score=16.56 TRINITY_DN626_c0_g1_i1:80-565(-)